MIFVCVVHAVRQDKKKTIIKTESAFGHLQERSISDSDRTHRTHEVRQV